MPGYTIPAWVRKATMVQGTLSRKELGMALHLCTPNLAERLPSGISQMFAEQNSIVLKAQGYPASGKVPTRVTAVGRAQHTPPPSKGAGGESQ